MVLKTAIYAASLNAMQDIAAFSANLPLVDLTVVADRGSRDGTPNRLAELGVVVVDAAGCTASQARERALASIPKDHLCLALDTADVLEGNLRQALAGAWRPGTRWGIVRTAWHHGGGASGWLDLNLARIHAQEGPPLPDDTLCSDLEEAAELSAVLIHHRSAANQLEGSGYFTEYPFDGLQYGLALLLRHHFRKASQVIESWLDSNPGLTPRRIAGIRLLAATRRAIGDYPGAARVLETAAIRSPAERSIWTDLVTTAHAAKWWAKCLQWAEAAELLPLSPKFPVVGLLPAAANTPHDLGSLAAWELGKAETALRLGQTALANEPTERIRANVGFFRASCVKPTAQYRSAPSGKPSLLLVSGPWSSGTTAVAGMVARLGAHGLGPYLTTPDPRTPDSHESIAFGAAIAKEVSVGPNGIMRNHSDTVAPALAQICEDIAWGVFDNFRGNKGAPLFAKFPSSALLLTELANHFDLQLIVVRRGLAEIEATRIRRGWEAIYGRAGAELIYLELDRPEHRHIPRLEIEYTKVLADPAEAVCWLANLLPEASSGQREAARRFVADRIFT